jgi:hypothetical protein
MTSFLISALARKYQGKQSEFLSAQPCCWLVWEPGVWRPPAKAGHTLTGFDIKTPPAAGGEALALALHCSPSRPGQITVGRAPTSDIEINDATLSQTHLLLMESAPGSWTVRDAGSKNGSWLDGIQLTPGVPCQLRSGARLQAAQVCLSFYEPRGLYQRLLAYTPTPIGQRLVPPVK